MVKETIKENIAKIFNNSKKSREQSLADRTSIMKRRKQRKPSSDSTEHQVILTQTDQNLQTLSTHTLTVQQQTQTLLARSTISQQERVRFMNHLMCMVKETKTLPFNFTVFKSAQYLDSYLLNVENLSPNLMETAILASILLVSQEFGFEGPNLQEVLQRVYQYKICYHQVIEAKAEMEELQSDLIQSTLYDIFVEHLKCMQNDGIIFSKQFLIKSHHYLRISLLKCSNNYLLPLSCLYLASQQSNSKEQTRNQINNFIFNKHSIQDLKTTIKFIQQALVQFGQQKHIFLMVSQLKGSKIFV